MRCKIPEISWHNRDPVLSVDIQPKTQATTTTINKNVYRLASGGTDAHVVIWHLKFVERNVKDDGKRESEGERYDRDTVLELAADLTRHQRAVNCVKWSPNGELLASGDDESVIFIWKQKMDNEPSVSRIDGTSEHDKEIWQTLKILRGHLEDIYDISWSPDSLHLVSGSVDNSAIIWDVQKGRSLAILNDHKGFVQGVTWDPRNRYIATLSTDRHLRIFDIKTKKVLQRVSKGCLPVDKCHPLHGKRMNLYHDDTLQTFFRRLTFTSDGTLLLTPSGVTDCEGAMNRLHTSYIYTRHNLSQPAIVLPCPDQYTVAVSCCRLLYRLRPYNADRNKPIIPLPYRMIFAVASRCSVYFYDTQQKPPFAIISNIHYTRLTDITWSDDGCIVIVSSTDGFCSLITFEPGELGELYDGEKVSTSDLSNTGIMTSDKLKETVEKETDRSGSGDGTDIEILKEEPKIFNEALSDVDLRINAKNVSPKEKCKNPQEETPAQESITLPQLPFTPATLPTAILSGDKEILSSDVKFETPEKGYPVTPINVRRHPRPPIASIASLDGAKTSAKNTPSKQILYADRKFEIPETKCCPVTPINIRKRPRPPESPDRAQTSARSTPDTLKCSIIPNENNATPIEPNRITEPAENITCTTTTKAPTPSVFIVEEATMDAWPITDTINSIMYKTKSTESHVDIDKTIEKKKGSNPIMIESDCGKATIAPLNDTKTKSSTTECTGDIHLVVEGTMKQNFPAGNVELSYTKKPIENTAKPSTEVICISPIKQQFDIKPKQELQTKTPRRVAFRTISTPKYKDAS